MNRYDLRDKVILITGGAGGIGRAVASLALANGARVSLWDRNQGALQDARDALGTHNAQRISLRAVDVTSENDIAQALAEDVTSHGRVDAFVNNAGILGEVLPLWETDPVNFRQVIEVNLIGSYLCLRAALKQMIAQTAAPMRGHVVNVASIQGKEGMPRAGAYSASKAALIGLTKTAGKETAELGITVNCVTPAAAETSMAKELTPERRAEILNRIPLGRFVEVEEIARMIGFLCSDDCSFSTGAVFDISGGRASY
jgi:NAD(P)-dependent dehydrogenase (short-subunit alcohol dehydrogenase family)